MGRERQRERAREREIERENKAARLRLFCPSNDLRGFEQNIY